MHVFYIYAKEKHSNKICKYKSLHEINFIHNECIDSVFIQQHMHTYILLFLHCSWSLCGQTDLKPE